MFYYKNILFENVSNLTASNCKFNLPIIAHDAEIISKANIFLFAKLNISFHRTYYLSLESQNWRSCPQVIIQTLPKNNTKDITFLMVIVVQCNKFNVVS